MHVLKSYIILTLLAVVALSACTNEAYDSGNTSLSYLKAEMVDMRVKNESVISIITDADESLQFQEGLKVSEKMARPDTTYRMMLYYNKVENQPIRIVSNTMAGLFNPMYYKVDNIATDPVTLTSAWLSPNGKYINIVLGLKTGTSDAVDARQKLYMACVLQEQMPSGNWHYVMRIGHDQGQVPEYYTVTSYTSLSTDDFFVGDQVDILVNTYNGEVTRTFVIGQW